jgi:hypothetical protein
MSRTRCRIALEKRKVVLLLTVTAVRLLRVSVFPAIKRSTSIMDAPDELKLLLFRGTVLLLTSKSSPRGEESPKLQVEDWRMSVFPASMPSRGRSI